MIFGYGNLSNLSPGEDFFLLFDAVWLRKIQVLEDLGIWRNNLTTRKHYIRARLLDYQEWKWGHVRLGYNRPVEFDETCLFKWKYNRGRLLVVTLGKIWVFVIIERKNFKGPSNYSKTLVFLVQIAKNQLYKIFYKTLWIKIVLCSYQTVFEVTIY